MTYYKSQHYDYSMASKIGNIIPDAWLKKQKIDTSKMKYGGKKMHAFRRCRSLFFEFLRLVIDDCIQTNCRFWSPGQKKWALYICEKTALEIDIILKKGIYEFVDVIKSEGLIYQFFIYSRWIGQIRNRPVRIGYSKYRELAERVNRGKRYVLRGPMPEIRETTFRDYVPRLMELYPDLTEGLIRKIIIRGCQNIFNNLRLEKDVLLCSPRQNVKFLIYMYRPYKRKTDEQKSIQEPAQ